MTIELTKSSRHTFSGCLLALTLLSLLLVPGNSATARTDRNPSPIKPHSIAFSVENEYMVAGRANLSLEQLDDGTWKYNLKVQPTGMMRIFKRANIEETSLLEITDGALRVKSYHYQQQGVDGENDVYAIINERAGKIEVTTPGGRRTIDFEGRIYDRLLVVLHLANLLHTPYGEEPIDAQILERDGIRQRQVRIFGDEVVQTALGNLPAVRITTGTMERRQTVTWYSDNPTVSPDGNYFPVRLEHRKRGELVFRLIIDEIKHFQ